jgi:hypothetical protein
MRAYFRLGLRLLELFGYGFFGYFFAFYLACPSAFQAVQYLMLPAFLGFPAL